MLSIWKDKEFGCQNTKEGYGLIRMRAETVGIWKEKEREFEWVYDMGESLVSQCLVSDKKLS